MKLNLVADYEIGGRRLAWAYAIDASNNLTKLNAMCCLSVPKVGGGFKYIAPAHLLACESGKKAREVADYWNGGYEKQGRKWKGEEVAA